MKNLIKTIRQNPAMMAKVSLAINLIYSAYNISLGIANNSWWFKTFGTYYLILSVMRFGLVLMWNNKNKNLKSQLFMMQFSGVLFILLVIVLLGTIILAFYQDNAKGYDTITMIAIATFSFTKIILAIINWSKSFRIDSPVIVTIRNISFADGAVSILNMQRAMLVSFPGMAQNEIDIFNICTGCGVCILVLTLGIRLIRKKGFYIGKIKNS